MTTDDQFDTLLTTMRPKLHRYCARMTGSTIDGEDVVQETLVKALAARASVADVRNPEAWLYRIAHNASLDFLRARVRAHAEPLSDELEIGCDGPQPDAVAAGFQTFLQLPVLQRCAVILKDVLGHSVEEIAGIADSSTAAAKSALQRGRQRLKELNAEGRQSAPLQEGDRERLQDYVFLFQSGEFDTIRQMLAEDVRLDLVGRLQWQGKKTITPYFTRYGEVPHWRFTLGAVEGRMAMLVYDARGTMERPNHFVLLAWDATGIAFIKDYLYAPYTLDEADWLRLT